MAMSSRRQFFKHFAALSGAAAMTESLLEAVQQAAAIDPAEGSTYLDAEHVVVLMQENRSFDHAFGRLRGVRGFNDPRTVTLPDGKPVWAQTDAAGETYTPFRLDIKNTKITWLGSLPHGWTDQTDARNHGNHDQWLQAKASGRKECAGMPLTLGYFEREDLPFYYALADAFTVCDQNFCSSLTGTTPNRLYLWTGTVRPKLDDSALPCVRNSEVNYNSTASWTTYPERLEQAGVSWKIYQNELSLPTGLTDEEDSWLANFTDNPIEWFDQFHVGFRETYQKHLRELERTLPGEVAALREKVKAGNSPALARELAGKERLLQGLPGQLAKWSGNARAAWTSDKRALHAKAFTTNDGDTSFRTLEKLRYTDNGTAREMDVPKGDVLYQFRKDVQSGKLPAVSWLVAPEKFSDHPGAPWYGSWYLAETIRILTQNPEVWKKTIFILTYDENDGYFDHVPPFVAPDPSNPESGKTSPGLRPELDFHSLERDKARGYGRGERGGPIGLGYRVPMIVASPWSRGGYVCSQVFDHTSPIQLMEKVLAERMGRPVAEPNITPWRRAVCGDLTSTFRPFRKQEGRSLPYPDKAAFFQSVHQAQFRPLPSGFRKVTSSQPIEKLMPRQEPGTRPSTALPYELHADGGLNADKTQFELRLAAGNRLFGAASAGSPFHAYTPNRFRGKLELRTRAYAVAAGENLVDQWAMEGFDEGIYHLRVHGPNGFYREMAGTALAKGVEVFCEYSNGGLSIRVDNPGSDPATFRAFANAYDKWEVKMTLPKGGSHTIQKKLDKSGRWYDFTVLVQYEPKFLRRYAGRVETGEEGLSDPVMA